MVGKQISAIYRYSEVVLASGAKVDANEVTIKNGKVININEGTVIIGEDENTSEFYFSAYTGNNELLYNTSNVKSGVVGQELAEEFVAFVEADYLSK